MVRTKAGGLFLEAADVLEEISSLGLASPSGLVQVIILLPG